MTYLHSQRDAAAHASQRRDPLGVDALLLDDECDDFLDRHIASIRESLGDRFSF